MTERMENALNHIKTSVDVDPWAMEEVERVFKGIVDAIAEIDTKIEGGNHSDEYIDGYEDGLEDALEIIRKHTGIGEGWHGYTKIPTYR